MSDFKGVKLSKAVLIQHLFIQGVGQLGPSLSSTQDGANKSVDMTLDYPFVILKMTDKDRKERVEYVPVTSFFQLTPVSEHKPLPKPLKE